MIDRYTNKGDKYYNTKKGLLEVFGFLVFFIPFSGLLKYDYLLSIPFFVLAAYPFWLMHSNNTRRDKGYMISILLPSVILVYCPVIASIFDMFGEEREYIRTVLFCCSMTSVASLIYCYFANRLDLGESERQAYHILMAVCSTEYRENRFSGSAVEYYLSTSQFDTYTIRKGAYIARELLPLLGKEVNGVMCANESGKEFYDTGYSFAIDSRLKVLSIKRYAKYLES